MTVAVQKSEFYNTSWKVPKHLKTKTQWDELGRKISGEPSATVQYYRGKTTDLYPIESTTLKRVIQSVIPKVFPPSIENIGAALYEVNKAAKRRRDAASSCYESGVHGFAAHQKSVKESHYALKDAVIKTANATNMTTFMGYHSSSHEREMHSIEHKGSCDSFYDGRGDCYQCGAMVTKEIVTNTNYFACYQIGEFRFHMPLAIKPDGEVLELGNWISSAAPCGTRMKLKDAIATLRYFIGSSPVELTSAAKEQSA
jgi:hypothetical protein